VEVRDLGEPEAVVSYPLGETSQVRLARTVVSRHVLQPGWSWEEHAQPSVGTTSCELYHRGVVLSGRMGIRTDEGEELLLGPNQVFDLPPGHVTWVEGDDVLVMVDWAGGAGFDPQSGSETRAMATILFTDIVDSTVLAREAGDASWERIEAMHEDVVRSVIAGFRGHEIETAGDSFLVVFDSAEGAIRCGLALVGALAAIRLSIRVGIHSGEVVKTGDNIRGVAVHTAARIEAHAGPGEVLVSGVTRDLTEGVKGLTFESRGRHRLKGLDREHELFAVADPGARVR
jgi:class 3 adenylate cyclase